MLIFLGAVIFLTLAPSLALYSSGLVFDWQKNQFVKTGILAFRTEPKKPGVFLDNKKIDDAGGTLRFLKPKNYLLGFSQDGYCFWQKHLMVKPGEVTWASPFNGKIFLLKSLPAGENIGDSGVVDYYYSQNQLYLLYDRSLRILPQNGQLGANIPLPWPALSLSPISGTGKFLITGQALPSGARLLVVDAVSQKSFDVSRLFSAAPKILPGPNGNFLALENGELYQISGDFSGKRLLLKNLSDFTVLGDDFYGIMASSSALSLFTAPNDETTRQTFLTGLPAFHKAQIFITDQKQVFVLGDGRLYLVGLGLKDLGAADSLNFNPSDPSLIYFGGSEANYFDFGSGQPRLLARSFDAFKNPIMAGSLGYGIWANNGQITALELDNRDIQNSCVLYQNANLQKFFLDEAEKNLFVLSGGQVKKVEIR